MRGKYSNLPAVRPNKITLPRGQHLRSDITNRELKAPAYAQSGIREYWILDINARRLYVFPEPGAECYASPVVLAESDLIAPLAFADCQVSVEDLLNRSADPSCE
ncbi:Uma2 family endonuclease [Microcoleus sp. D3_18a_C4]